MTFSVVVRRKNGKIKTFSKAVLLIKFRFRNWAKLKKFGENSLRFTNNLSTVIVSNA